MNIQGVVVFVGDVTSGTSGSGRAWRKQEFMIETTGQYPKKVAFSLFNDAIDKSDPSVILGKGVDVYFDPESREYNGKFYTELKAWKVTSIPEADSSLAGDGYVDDDLPY